MRLTVRFGAATAVLVLLACACTTLWAAEVEVAVRPLVAASLPGMDDARTARVLMRAAGQIKDKAGGGSAFDKAELPQVQARRRVAEKRLIRA
jgi:hypothetical protein